MKKLCQTCRSMRLVSVIAKSGEFCVIEIAGKRRLGAVPKDMGIGGEEYIELRYCLNCGQVQGMFPLPTTDLEKQK
ncbi:MAG: hypothetical protein HY22_01190 [[Candidatus Thermochlorobacteriaceae] bacterium GBChlB]|nr:MAG: hypothetical protein HY22_01190 [[Candidatus Thermochlorobacteriaceae] bacterium GBChlB]